MAIGKMTEIGMEKLIKAHAGECALSPIKYMAVGEGGVNEERIVIPATGQEVCLRKELLRKEIEEYHYSSFRSCEYVVFLEEGELTGKEISEAGLIDEEGDLIAYKAFAPKGKDAEDKMGFSMSEELSNREEE